MVAASAAWNKKIQSTDITISQAANYIFTLQNASKYEVHTTHGGILYSKFYTT